MPDPIRAVNLALRVSLASAYLSAVADRFGGWGPSGTGNVAWGNLESFADSTHQLLPFASGWLLTALVWGATSSEVVLAVLLLAGIRPKVVGALSCALLTTFGLAMAISLGVEAPLSYSVFTAASASAAYAVLGAKRSVA